MNYLDLVNEALRESGTTLDQLTSGTFVTPTDPLYTKFKNWTIQAWEDVQTDRRDWEFMQKSAVIKLYPRMEVYGVRVTGDAAASFDDLEIGLYVGDDVRFMTKSSGAFTLESGALADDDAEGYMDFESVVVDDSMLDAGERLVDYSGTNGAVFYFRRWGRYDLTQTGAINADEAIDVAEVKHDSIAIADVALVNSSTATTPTETTYTKLAFVPYNKWLRYGYDRPVAPAKPTKCTISNDGRIQFYPPMDVPYNVYFEYTRTPQTFSTYTDTPTGLPSRFHKAISWRALMYYGEYDGISRIYNIAKARYSKFEYEMVRDLLPEVNIGYDARRF